ncbi:MAG: hypothetical protein EPN20_01765 [Magnetospirillum sp.]|nr:MAG: hypothetical protein EPN20_01765 [Magnetospirillum sp.]
MASRPLIAILAGVALLAAAPALAGGKKEGAGESGGGAIAPIASDTAGPREVFVPSEQASPSLGDVLVTATMMAGAGAGKCRMNFIITNQSTTPVTMGAVATAINAKGEVTDNWAISVGLLAPNGQTARLFSCGLGATKLILTPLSEFSWPPVKCAKPDREAEACSLGMRVKSTLALGEKGDIKQTPSEPAKKH